MCLVETRFPYVAQANLKLNPPVLASQVFRLWNLMNTTLSSHEQTRLNFFFQHCFLCFCQANYQNLSQMLEISLRNLKGTGDPLV